MEHTKKNFQIYPILYPFLFFFLVAASLLPGLQSTVNAQNFPGEQDPGVQAKRFQTDVEAKKEEMSSKKPHPSAITPPQSVPAAASSVSFVLKGMKFQGMTLFKNEELASLYQSYLGTKVSMKEINEVIERLKEKYHERGYFAVSVFFPEQEVRDGNVRAQVIEGKLGAVRIEGNKWVSSKTLGKYFHTLKGEVLNIKKIQRDLLRLNRNQDLQVRTVLTQGTEPETVDMTLQATDKFPWHIGAGADNQGSRLTGKYRVSGSLRSTNTTGRLDSLFLAAITSGNSFGQSANYELPVSTYGGYLGIEQTFFSMDLGKEFKSLLISGKSYIYTPYYTQELFLSESASAYGTLGLDIKSTVKKQDEAMLTHDELRMPYISFDLRRQDARGQTIFIPRFNFSPQNFLGASARFHPSASRLGADGFFFTFNPTVKRLQKMPLDSYMILNLQGQLASKTLPSSEQFQIGGVYSVRGYPEGDYLADMGGSLNIDWIFPMYCIPSTWKLAHSKVPLRHQIEPLIFFDIGGGKLKKILPGERHNKILLGAGGGFRVRLHDNVFVRFEWANHLGDDPVSGAGPSTFRFAFQTEM